MDALVFVALIIVAAGSSSNGRAGAAANFKKCGRKQPNFNHCLSGAVHDAINILDVPMEDYGIPTMDPFVVPLPEPLVSGDRSVGLEIAYTTLTVFGFTKVESTNASMDFENKVLTLELTFPSLRFEFNFEGHGVVVFLTVDTASTGIVIFIPLGALADIASNTIDDSAVEEDAIVDDFTTHGLERLSSAATCLVAGVEYTHGQQIYRSDPCEFCLCLDGEMFCWWQDCPPTMEGPCKDRGPFTPCINPPPPSFSSSSSSSASTSKLPTMEQESSTSETETDNSTDTSTFTSDSNSTEEAPPTTQQHRFCLVMGRKYEIGDKLPHDTGNCVECVCAQGAKVTCSPHQCAPAGDDLNDYRPPGPRQQDVF